MVKMSVRKQNRGKMKSAEFKLLHYIFGAVGGVDNYPLQRLFVDEKVCVGGYHSKHSVLNV